MKKLLMLLLLVLVLMSFTSPALATDDITVYVDDQLLQIEDHLIIQEGRTLAPMRAFFESLDASVDWDPETRTAIGIRGDITVRIPIGSTIPTINNRAEPIEVAAQIIGGRTYIPLRFVGEAFGDDVQWNGATRSITITRNVEEHTGNADTEKRDSEDPIEALNINIKTNPENIPEGGGYPVTINIIATDDLGYLAEGVHVSFNAEAFEAGERNGQLSKTETTTDALGQANVTYTTLAADDRRFVTVSVAVSKDDVMEHKKLNIIAADQVATVSGVVRNPFTGAPLENVCVHFMKRDPNRSIGFAETDAGGYYSTKVPTDNYSMVFDMEKRDQITVNISNRGENYTVNNNKGVLKGVVTGVSPGSLVMAIPPDFDRNSPDNYFLQAEVASDGSFTLVLFPKTYELFIVGRSNPFKTGVSVQSGQVTDMGSINAR